MSRYTVYVTPTVWEELKDLPGHMRQRVRRAITALADDPSPATSKALTPPGQPRETSATEDLLSMAMHQGASSTLRETRSLTPLECTAN